MLRRMPEDPPAPPPPPESTETERGWFARVRRSRLIAGVVWTAEQAGKLAILVTIVNYFLEAPDRLKSKEFQAWQLVNSARTGDGGRKLALHDLVQEDVDLSGLNLDGANLFGADLRGGDLNQVSFAHAVLDTTDFSCRPRRRLLLLIDAACQATNLGRSVFTAPMLLTSFRGARLDAAEFSTPGAPGTVPRDAVSFLNFSDANAFGAEFHDLGIWDANFSGASLEQTRFVRVQFARTSFDRADLRHRPAPGRRTAFEGVSFSETTFAGADLTGATFVAAVVELPAAEALANTLLCQSGASCEPQSRPLTEDDLKGALLCRTVVNGRRSDRDCAAAKPDDLLP